MTDTQRKRIQVESSMQPDLDEPKKPLDDIIVKVDTTPKVLGNPCECGRFLYLITSELI